MKFKELQEFLVVAERGSLRAAARQLHVAQPAITRGIQELEKELGVVLFERRATGVSLTKMGHAFYRRASAIYKDLRHAKDELAQMRGETQGEITVCLSTVAHMVLLPRTLKIFRQRYPKVRIEIMDALLPRIQQNLVDGTIDCYVGPVAEDIPNELRVEKLFDNTRVILGRKGHPLAQARSLRDLVDAEWVTSSITHRVEDELTPLFEKHNLPPPRSIIHAHSALTFLLSVAYSDLLMLLPVQWIQEPLFSGALQRIEVAEKIEAPPICIVHRIRLPLTPAAEHFCDVIRRVAKHREQSPGPGIRG